MAMVDPCPCRRSTLPYLHRLAGLLPLATLEIGLGTNKSGVFRILVARIVALHIQLRLK